jgi:AcrR family transcriptional regulator
MERMARWAPDAQGRLLSAAIELFGEQGYEATTTAQIAGRAGLTKTTLFRLFPDKREILFQGQATLVTLAGDGVREAPAAASPLDLLTAGITAMTDEHPAERRVIGRRLEPIIASSPELRERAVAKRWAITRAVEEALTARLGDPRAAGVLADLGVRAYYEGYASWLAADDDRSLTELVRAELGACAAALRQLLISPYG